MMNSTGNQKIVQIERQKENLYANKADISLTRILSSEKCQYILNNCREFRHRTYTPLKTIIMFTKQVLASDKSCRHAVAGAVAQQVSVGETASSTNTGPYCKARQRLPELAMKNLAREIGQSTADNALNDWKWRGHKVKLVDGTTCTASDTLANQQAFPQHKNQAPGAGFPMLRLVVLMSLSAGTVLNYAVDACKGKGTGEHGLFRKISDSIDANDILLGDRYYPSFF